MTVASYDDVLGIERVPLAERKIPPTPYDMLRAGAAIAPDAPALSFFAQVARFKKATVWSYRELFRRITQAGNLFRRASAWNEATRSPSFCRTCPKRISPSGAGRRRESQ